MFWNILPHVSACIAADKVILLDLRLDRYLMVPDQLNRTVQDWLGFQGRDRVPSSFADMLVKSGTLRPGDPELTNAVRTSVEIPGTLTDGGMPVSATLSSIIRVSALLAVTSLALRTRPLHATLQRLSRRSAGEARAAPAHLAARARHFACARRFVPIAEKCLLDSLALDAWLSQDGRHSQLILGVMSQPFGAHCWLQTSSDILNDHYDRVSRFTPILVV
ncbi:MAG: lasso peptide biosynthesis B2 protein [Sphingomonas sp.]